MIGDYLREAHLLLAAGGEPAHHGTGTVAGWAKELFDIHGPTFWVAVAFVIFVAFMVWKARKALVGGLDARAVRIKAEIDEAQRLREEAQALLADYQKKQREALNEAQAMLRQAEEEGQRLRAKAEIELEGALKRREQQALDRIAQAEQHALAEVRNLAADLAVAATEKLLTEKLGTAQAEAMVSDAIADLPHRLQ